MKDKTLVGSMAEICYEGSLINNEFIGNYSGKDCSTGRFKMKQLRRF